MRTSFTLLTAFLALISALPNPQVSSSSASISETSSTQASSTATSSHSASSESQSPPTSTGTPDENKKSATDDFLLYGEGGFSAGLVEDKWSKTCDDPAVKNFKEHPDKSWADLGCDEMHNALIYEWWMHRNETDLPYFEYVAGKLGANDWKCSTEECHKPDLQCTDTKYTCGHLILNSISNIHAMFKDALDSVHAARKNASDQVGFTEFFELDKNNDAFKKAMLDPLKRIGLYVTGMFANDLRGLVGLRTDKSLDKHLHDAFAEVGLLAMPYSKFDLGDSVDGDTIDDKLKNILNKVYDQAINMQEKHFNDLFSEKGRMVFWKLSSNGTFVNINVKVGANMDLYLDHIKQMVIAALVPKAWEEHPKFQNKGELPNMSFFSRPFFINTGQGCADGAKPQPIEEWGNHDLVPICHGGKKWYAMVVKVTSEWSWEDRNLSIKPELIQPPKVAELQTDRGFEYVDVSGMLASAYQGWEQGNHAQYWTPPEDATVVKGEGLRELQFAARKTSAGLVQMQVCPNWEQSTTAIRETLFKDGRPDIERLKKRTWPCDG